MDKQFTFTLIGTLAIAVGFLSYAALEGPKRTIVCKVITLGYIAFMWLCIIALVVLTLLYK